MSPSRSAFGAPPRGGDPSSRAKPGCGVRWARSAGFTLIEVLVALAVMAVLAGLAWRGLDGMVRARDGSQQALERTARLNTILAQWQQDLDALHDTGVVPPLAFDGRTLRLTRTVNGGVELVAWSLYGQSWQRWTSPPFTRVNELQDAWLRSQQLMGNEPAQVRLLDRVDTWQLYYFRANAWTNAQSTGDLEEKPDGGAPPAPAAPAGSGVPPGEGGTPPPPAPGAPPPAAAREQLPDAVRLVVTLSGQGTLTRDLAVTAQRL